LTDRLEDLVVVPLLPAFFAFTGLRTQIGLVRGGGEWLLCLLIIVVASLGKFEGAAAAARLTGLGWRDSAALGVLMNTRGLMELIVLNIGYELGVISPTLFAMLVLMALVTTFMTTPILHLLEAKEELLPKEARPRPAAKLRVVRSARQGILVPVSNPRKVGVLMDLALSAARATTLQLVWWLSYTIRPEECARESARSSSAWCRVRRRQPNATPSTNRQLRKASWLGEAGAAAVDGLGDAVIN
jgi:Sodium/hydrogen exchanger family